MANFRDKAESSAGKRYKKLSDFGGNFGRHKDYLNANGILSPSVPLGGGSAGMPSKRNPRAVPWALKGWSSFTDEDKRGLAEHLRGLTPERAAEYKRYLVSTCGVPRGALGGF